MARLPHYIAQGEASPSQRVLHPGWMVYVENYIKVAHGWLNGWFMWLKWFIYMAMVKYYHLVMTNSSKDPPFLRGKPSVYFCGPSIPWLF